MRGRCAQVIFLLDPEHSPDAFWTCDLVMAATTASQASACCGLKTMGRSAHASNGLCARIWVCF